MLPVPFLIHFSLVTRGENNILFSCPPSQFFFFKHVTMLSDFLIHFDTYLLEAKKLMI